MSSEQKNIAIFATIVLCACGSVLLLSTQSDLMDARKRLEKIDQTIYTKKEKDTLGIEEETNAFGRGLRFTVPMLAVIWLGAAMVISRL